MQVADDGLILAIWNAITQGACLKDINVLPSETLGDIYANAYDFYQSGRLDDAETFFRFLCIYDFYNPDYLMGMGAVFHLKKQYAQACDLYAVAFALAKGDYRPVFYTGQCQLALNDRGKARQCFETVLERCSDDQLRAKAQGYLDLFDTMGVPVHRVQRSPAQGGGNEHDD